uniref:Negative regulator of ubiquitin like proteins 1 n=1 Tax=Haplochromis burtoni TaxID=8153 RepID=A0A3Q2UVD2_HAPBU
FFFHQELAERYAPLLRLPVSEVGGALESIRAQAVKRGRGNQTFRETSVATLELLLPRDAKKVTKTRLDVSAQQVVDRYSITSQAECVVVQIACVCAERRLDEQGVKNHSKVMVLRVSDGELKQQLTEEEEERRSQEESVQRTQKGFQILSERDGSEDPDTTPFLEIADQKGNPLKIPPTEKKALILAMGFHEKGRALMKRKQHDNALCHLLQADQQFREEVLFLRLYLLQSLLSYIEGSDSEARLQLSRVESLYARLRPDSEKMAQLMALGFSEREARLGLRASRGDLQEAAIHISTRRQEREELKQRERQKRRTRMEAISALMELGFSQRDAARALHHADGNVDRAYAILLDSSQDAQATNNNTEGGLLYLGFERDSAEAALRLTGGDVQSATQLLLDSQGVLSPELLTPPSTSSSSSTPSSEEPSSASSSPGNRTDSELVSEVLEDIAPHEEDYLDLTLEEESELISAMKAYLHREPAHT